jgi:hypothetical protein
MANFTGPSVSISEDNAVTYFNNNMLRKSQNTLYNTVSIVYE